MPSPGLVLGRTDAPSPGSAAPVARAADVAVSVSGLEKTYRDGTCANRGIDLDVRRGEILAILGPNGAGKTTFLRQVTTELRPTSGTITVFGIDIVRDPDRAKRLMGVTPQEAGVFESLTVHRHLELFARLKGLAAADARRSATQIAAELGLADERSKRVGHLSGGQRRRVLVALSLLGRPPLLVLDEPTTGLDPASRRAVWAVIRRAVRDGASVVLSTHAMDEAERLSDRVAIISAGRLIALGTVRELLLRVSKSYRLTFHDPFDPSGERISVQRCSTFAEAQAEVRRQGLSEYSIARASLEDVYFELAGEAFPGGER